MNHPPIDRLLITHPDSDHVSDIAFVSKNQEVFLFQCKANGTQSDMLPRSLMQAAQFGIGKTALFTGQGKTEQVLLHALAVGSILVDVNSELGPLSLDPPKLANFLICLIPLKHRGNLLGDLEEQYWNKFIPRHGVRKARFLYWAQAFYELAGFMVRPLAGIAGLGFVRKIIEILIHRMTK